jgi:phosphoesterase RecJ-like protein
MLAAADIDRLLTLFDRAQSFVLTTHVHPDGDGIGSALALAASLRARGKSVAIINHSPTPAVFRWLDPGGSIRVYEEERDRPAILTADALIVVDTNHPDRLRSLGPAVLESRAVKVCIDHHLDPHPFASLTVIDTEATSTGEIVYHLLVRLQGPDLPAPVATALYCAIMTDTGSFRYPRVNAGTHRIVARLIECGADPVAIYTAVYEQWSEGRIRLLGETLAGLRTGSDGRLAHVSITRDMLARTGTREEDTDNFTTYPMSIAGAEIGILFLEMPSGVKISFRSRGEIPINRLAQDFGGNGHKNAAGARILDAPLASVRERILAAASAYLPAKDQHA